MGQTPDLIVSTSRLLRMGPLFTILGKEAIFLQQELCSPELMQPAGFFRPILELPVAHGVEPDWKEEK